MKSRWQRIARAIRRRPRRIIAASSTRSDPKNRSANRLIRTPSARGPPTADRHRDSYASSGVPSRRWSAAVSPAYRPAIIATLFPPPFVAMTMPAASPTSITLSFTVRGGAPMTGTNPPVALPGSRSRERTNRSNTLCSFPWKYCHVPRQTFAQSALRRPDPDHGGVDLAHVIGDRHEILQSLDVRENRPNFLVVRDIFAALHGHADLLALVDEEDLEPASRRVPGGRSTRRPGADHDHVVRRWHSATSSRVARQDIIDEADHAGLGIAVGDRVQGLLGELPIRLRVEPGLFHGAGIS